MDNQLNLEIESTKAKIAQLEVSKSEHMLQYEGSSDNMKLMFLDLLVQMQKQISSLEEQITQLQKQKTIQVKRASSIDSRPSTPMTTNSRPTTPFEQDYMHNADWVNQFLFFIEEVGYKSCVVALTPNYLVTFRHGTHQGYVKDSTVVRVVSLKSGAQYEAAVVYINEEEDYVILKSNEKVVDRNCPIQQCDVMKPFVVCGFGKGFPEQTFIRGTVCSIHPFIYENNGKSFGPFIYGTAKTSPGDYGAACFGTCGLMAINLGTTTMPLKQHNEAISEAAIFSPNNYMVTAFHILAEIAKLEPNKPPKRPYHEINIEGYGKFEF